MSTFTTMSREEESVTIINHQPRRSPQWPYGIVEEEQCSKLRRFKPSLFKTPVEGEPEQKWDTGSALKQITDLVIGTDSVQGPWESERQAWKALTAAVSDKFPELNLHFKHCRECLF